MIHNIRNFVLACVFLVGALFACGWIAILAADPHGWWRFMSLPPVPPNATFVKVQYPTTEGERELSFETEESSKAIQQFYREELPKQGWVFVCTVDWSLPVEPYPVESTSVQPTPTSIPEPTEIIPPFVPPPGAESIWDVYERRDAQWLGREQTLDVEIGARESFGGTGPTNSAELSEWEFRREQTDRCVAQ